MTTNEIREARLADLQVKLKAREGKPGMAANVEAIKKQMRELEAGVAYQHDGTGQFVSVEFAIQNPETAIAQERGQ